MEPGGALIEPVAISLRQRTQRVAGGLLCGWIGIVERLEHGGKRGLAEAAAAAPVEPDLSRPIKPYKPSELYQLRDRIQHRTFGVGVVEDVSSAGKIQVRFPEGPKKLLHGAPAT